MKALLSMERELWEGGPDVYRRHVDDDCLLALAERSHVASREEVAASVEVGPRWSNLRIEVEGFLRPKASVAILTYRALASRGDGRPYWALVSSGYVIRAGEWKLMFHQQTPLPIRGAPYVERAVGRTVEQSEPGERPVG